MKKINLILFFYALSASFLNYLNIKVTIFIFLTIFLSIICSILIEKLVIHQIKCEAEEDYLTMLKNKKAYLQKKQYFNYCNSVGVMFLDINNLKIANDTYGHAAGDELIISVSNVIKKHTRKGIFSYRFGGDEFVIILTNITKEQFSNFEKLLVNDISKINLKLSSLKVSVAVGQSYEDNQINIERALKNADDDMYDAKRKIKN